MNEQMLCFICQTPTEETGIFSEGRYNVSRGFCGSEQCLIEYRRREAEKRQHTPLGKKAETEDWKRYKEWLKKVFNGEVECKEPWVPGKRFYGAVWATLKSVQAAGLIDIAQKFLNNDYQFMVFMGLNGRGKTWASFAIIHAYMANSYGTIYDSAEFITWSDLNILAHRANANHSSGEAAEKRLQHLSSVGLLVIDEFGITKPLDLQFHQIFSLIDKRFSEKRHTLITTTRNEDELKETMGGGILSRFSSGAVVTFGGPDQRRVKGQ